MPLSSTRLSAAMRAAFLGNAATRAEDNAALTAVCDEIAAAILAEIVANAVVVPLTMVTGPSGGPVTGTGIVT